MTLTNGQIEKMYEDHEADCASWGVLPMSREAFERCSRFFDNTLGGESCGNQ